MSSLRWCNYDWSIRDTGGRLSGPGPNVLSRRNAWIDSACHLHLALSKDPGGRLTSAEVDGPHLGYGTYEWIVDADPTGWDAQAVLGLFTYDRAAKEGPPYFAREIDIEFAKWSTPDNKMPICYSVQQGGARTDEVPASSKLPLTVKFTWTPGRVEFSSKDSGGEALGTYTVTRGVQKPDREVVIMNLWHSDPDYRPGVPTEVVIRSFTFTSA